MIARVKRSDAYMYEGKIGFSNHSVQWNIPRNATETPRREKKLKTV